MSVPKPDSWVKKLKPAIGPGIVLLLMIAAVVFLSSAKDNLTVEMNGMTVVPPVGYKKTFSDSRFVVWEYTGSDRKPGKLILDTEIRGDNAQLFSDASSVIAECEWLTEAEIYTNPQGVRMARGFSTKFSGYPERRYYVESKSTVMVLCMIEDSRYYDPADCEEVMRQTADSIRPAN